MKPEMKKLIIANLPYLLFVYLFGKLGQAYRLAEGIDLSQKLLHFADGCAAAFESAAPSFHPIDLLIGVAGAAALRLMVYCKGKNAKKYRKGVEYGSARWGGPKDIAPYIDPNFDNNILLTQTERLTMNNRPKDPKTARNKNVLVIGGSGSGKTRFFVKPNLMQCVSKDYPTSFVITDPNGNLQYHCNISIVSRGKGKSAVAAAAYRSGEKITNEWDGMTHDYTRKRGVVHTEILLPPHAPPSFSDRATLWNSVELYEKAGNAQLAREIDAALPIELSREEQIRLVREYCSSQFVSRGMCVDFAIHDTDSGNPHCHIMLTMRPLDERGAWAAKSKKEYDLDENGERIRLPSGRYKTHKVDLTGWNDKGNALLWRKAWADISNAYLERAGHPERIDHRSNAERGIDELPTVHMGVAACQMEKKGIATEKGELNRNIQKANRLIREIRAQIGKLKEWIGELFKARETAPEQPPQSPGLANLLMKYLSVQREKSRKYSQSWQRQHAADELKTVAKAVNYLSEHGISTLDELDAALSSVSDKAYSIREGMKTAEQRMKELQKLMEYGRNYQTYKPIQDEYRQIRWKGKQEKFAEARRAELTLWDAANRYLHAHLPEGVKTLPISAWEKEYTALKAQREAEYETLKDTRAEVAELQKIRKCVDIALRADQPAQTQSRTKRQEQER